MSKNEHLDAIIELAKLIQKARTFSVLPGSSIQAVPIHEISKRMEELSKEQSND